MRLPDGGGLTAAERARRGAGAAGGSGADRGRGQRPGGRRSDTLTTGEGEQRADALIAAAPPRSWPAGQA